MSSSKNVLLDSLQTGALASVTTALTAAAAGKLEGMTAAAPLNAVSHIPWGDEAAQHDDVSAKYTLTGVALNSAAVTSWAFFYEMLFGSAARKGDASLSLAGGVAVALFAYFVDYFIVPERLTPGFEKRLSGASLFAIYMVLALSLGIGGLLKRSEPQDRSETTPLLIEV